LETRRNDEEPRQWRKEDREPKTFVERLKVGAMAVRCAPGESSSAGFAIVRDASADLLARTLQNIPVEVLIYPFGLEEEDEGWPHILTMLHNLRVVLKY
jgi:hypothetical protein